MIVVLALALAAPITPELRVQAGFPEDIDLVRWSPSGRLIATQCYGSRRLSVWDARTGAVVRQLGPLQGGTGSDPQAYAVVSVAREVGFLSDDHTVAVVLDGAVQLWDAATGQHRELALRVDASRPHDLVGDRLVATDPADPGAFVVHDLLADAKIARVAVGEPLEHLALSPDGRVLLATGTRAGVWKKGKVKLVALDRPTRIGWDATGAAGAVVGADGTTRVVRGRKLVVGSSGGVRLRDRRPVWQRASNLAEPWLSLSPDGRLEVVLPVELDASGPVPRFTRKGDAADDNLFAEIVDVGTGNPVGRLEVAGIPGYAAFTRDGRLAMLTISPDDVGPKVQPGNRLFFPELHALVVWDPETGPRRLPLTAMKAFAPFVPFGTATLDRVIHARRDAGFDNGPEPSLRVGGRRIALKGGPFPGLGPGVISPDARTVAAMTVEGGLVLWDTASGDLLGRAFLFEDGWAVVDAAGRFDASHAGDIDALHWVIGTEVVGLDQLARGYYTPGLLRALLRREALPEVRPLAEIGPLPGLEVGADGNTVWYRAADRGTGLGRVAVLVNGKEIVADARPRGASGPSAEGRLDLSASPFLRSDGPNRVEVRAWDGDGFLVTRSTAVFLPPVQDDADRPPPSLRAVVVGTSDYGGDALDLGFAAGDAEDFAEALRVGGEALFGVERTHVTLLTSPGERPPTRASLLEALDGLKDASSSDVVVVYLAGHGVTWGGADAEFHYLTAEAWTGDLADPAARAATVTTADLVERMTASPALRQVLILDTCASGAAIDDLGTSRAPPSARTRALASLEDRTGMFVLAGSAADAVSYEASRYGQGLLTWSALFGMRGAFLVDGSVVDARTLLERVADEVPKLARGLGGIQRPEVHGPRNGSFPLGLIEAGDRDKIPLKNPLPVVVRSSFQDEDALRDVAGVGAAVDELLRGYAAQDEARIVFVDAVGYPDGISVAGRYRLVDGVVKARVVVSGAGLEKWLEVEAPPEGVAEAVTRAVLGVLP